MDTRTAILREIFASMATSHRLIHGHLQRSFAKHGLSMSQLQLLHIICDSQPISLKDLAGKMHLTPGAITQQTDSLADAGFVVRSQDRHDRRVTNISLSAKAKRTLEKFRKMRERTFTEATASLDEQELQTFLTVQQKMLTYFEQQQTEAKRKEKQA